MSSCVPRFPVSVSWSRWWAGSGAAAARAVPIRPGARQFTVTWSAARSWASARVKPTRPALAVTTCARCLAPVCALSPPMLTMVPAPPARSCGSAAFTQWNAPSRITPRISRQSSKPISSSGCSRRSAALLTRISMRPKRSTAAAIMVSTASASATSARHASARPFLASISRTTACASSRFERALTRTAAPAAASSSAMARPMLRPAPVTTATRPASSLRAGIKFLSHPAAQERKLDRAVPQRAGKPERRGNLLVAPAAVACVAQEFRLDLGAIERLTAAATQMRLAFFDDAAALQQRADVAGIVRRIGVLRIDHVAHFCRDAEDGRIAHRFIAERIESDAAVHEAGRDAIRRAEFRRVAVRRPLLLRQRLPQPMHRCVRDFADQRFDLAGRHAARVKPARTVDVRMDHGAARIRLEGERPQYPAFPEIAAQRRVLAADRLCEAVEEAVNAFEHRARTEKSRAPQQRRAQARLRRPARMQPLGPGAFGQRLDDPARHAAGGPQRIDELPLAKTE